MNNNLERGYAKGIEHTTDYLHGIPVRNMAEKDNTLQNITDSLKRIEKSLDLISACLNVLVQEQ